jgi:hypothetical protein
VEWWELFECPTLGDPIGQALDANPTQQAAQASLCQSEDLRAGYAVFATARVFKSTSASSGRSVSGRPD